MKLTDQEQVILKAIGPGVAEIARVIRAVGYPKATTKKVLVRLNEKGIVALHRHDYPQSLTPAQRKLMVRIGRDYYNAVSMRKRNPKRRHLAGATVKEQRQYEAIKKSELKRGKSPKTAKRIAAATVRKQQKRAKRNATRTVHAVRSKTRHRVVASKAQRTAKRAVARKNVAPKRKATRTTKARSVVKTRKAPARRVAGRSVKKSSGFLKSKKRGRKNPSAESIRKKFAGRVSGERDVFVPASAPKGKLAKLGNLVLIQTERGTIKPVHGSAVLLADTRGKFHIGSTSGANLFDGPRRNFGRVSRIEYEGSKPHLGFKSPIIWNHRMGEETGQRPTLHADGKGGLVFRGGRYRLTRRGIEN